MVKQSQTTFASHYTQGYTRLSTSVKEGDEATRCFYIPGTVSLAVVVVALFDPHLAGHHLAVIRKDDECFCSL